MPYAGDDVSELEAGQEPRLVRALEMVAPGTAIREGLDNIVQAQRGALVCIGESAQPERAQRVALLAVGAVGRLDLLDEQAHASTGSSTVSVGPLAPPRPS